jgi:hypothetical protein
VVYSNPWHRKTAKNIPQISKERRSEREPGTKKVRRKPLSCKGGILNSEASNGRKRKGTASTGKGASEKETEYKERERARMRERERERDGSGVPLRLPACETTC